MTLSLQSACANDPCQCKVQGVPPQANGQPWPRPGDAFQLVIYAGQDHYSQLVPGGPFVFDGGGILDGIGAQWITPHGVGPFGWNFGPTSAGGPPDWGGVYFTAYLNFFDGYGDRPIGGVNTFSNPAAVGAGVATYGTVADAQANAQIFKTYFYG